jgi:hypothetical protein
VQPPRGEKYTRHWLGVLGGELTTVSYGVWAALERRA